MIIINVTYKTNRYRLSLLIIIGVNALRSSFYMIFCFLVTKEDENYLWALQQYRSMCIELDIRDSIINITDRERSLINAYHEIFSDSVHMLCV